MSTSKLYSTKRNYIVDSLVTAIKTIDGTGEYNTDLQDQVSPRLLFWDEITNFPCVHLTAGSEVRDYLGGGVKDRYLDITVKCYVNEENAAKALGDLLEDLENLLETNSRLQYIDSDSNTQHTQQISIISIDTDEGVLEPLGVADMIIQVRY